MIHRTPVRLQASAVDCGAVCLGIVLEFHGHFHSSPSLRRLCGVQRDGASVAQIQRGAIELGHECLVMKKGLQSLKGLRHPIILHWDMRHFVVWEGIRGGSVWINDPAIGRRKMSIMEFDQHFTGVCLEINCATDCKNQKKLASWGWMNNLLPDRQPYIGGTVVASLLSCIVLFSLELLFAGVISTVFDYVVAYQMSSWGYLLVLGGALVVAFRFCINSLHAIWIDKCNFDLSATLKRNSISRLFHKPPEFFEAHFAGELFSRLQDIDQCLRFKLKADHSMGGRVVIAVAAGIVLWLVAPLIAAVYLLPRVLLLGWFLLAKKHGKEAELRARDASARYEVMQVQRADGFLRLFANGVQDQLITTCLPLLGLRQSARVDQTRLTIGPISVQRSLDTTLPQVVIFVGTYLLIDGQLTFGGFMLANVLVVLLYGQVHELTEVVLQYMRLRPVAQRVAETLDDSENFGAQDLDGATPSPSTKDAITYPFSMAAIEVIDLCYGYSGNDADLFHNLNFKITTGEVVNLTGPSGVGKSTLLDLLAGVRKPDSGIVLYAGKRIHGPAPAGYVFADDEYIHGSLADFISNGEAVDKARMVELLKLSDLWNRLGFSVELDGDKHLEDQNLSRGEIQRLLLAQALYRSSDCLLIDEAFHHLSDDQSALIIQGLRDRNVTVIMASHRPTIQSLCDRSIHLRSGQSTE